MNLAVVVSSANPNLNWWKKHPQGPESSDLSDGFNLAVPGCDPCKKKYEPQSMSGWRSFEILFQIKSPRTVYGSVNPGRVDVDGRNLTIGWGSDTCVSTHRWATWTALLWWAVLLLDWINHQQASITGSQKGKSSYRTHIIDFMVDLIYCYIATLDQFQRM